MDLIDDANQQDIPPPPEVNPDQAVLSLMAMAENFRVAKPPRYKMAIKCVMAALKIPCSTALNALCNYELGKLLWLYTKNTRMARGHLKRAYNMMRDLGQNLELTRLAVVCLISEIYISERCYEEIQPLLRNEIAESRKYPLLHAKLLFLYGELYLRMHAFDKALEVANSGIAYFREVKEIVIECFFRLTKSLILSIQMTNQQELGNSVSELGEILSNVSNSVPALNDIRAFCYSIQLCYFLATGMLKSSKQCLRQLHMTVQALEGQDEDLSPRFRWLDRKMLTGLAYVLTVLSNIQYSNFERAHRYHGTALQHFQSLRAEMHRSSWPIVERGSDEFISRMELVLHEAMAQTQLVMSNPLESIGSIETMIKNVRVSPLLMEDFSAQIHTLLGLYSVYMRVPADAEAQLKMALKKTNDSELTTVVNLSLAVLCLSAGREADFYDLFASISPTRLPSTAISLKSAAYYVHAIHYFLLSRDQDCKSHLMDSINISKEEDMARLQAMALLLLSTMLRPKDTDVLKMAYEWATKSNDNSLMIWANSQIIDLHLSAQQAAEAEQASTASTALSEKLEGGRRACAQSQLHSLIKWK